MRDHEEYEVLLSAMLDGELSEEEAAEVREHLAACGECSRYLEQLRAIREALREDRPEAPKALREGIQYKLGLEKRRRGLRFGAFGRWTAIAAVLCIAVFGVVRLGGSGVSRADSAAPAAGGLSMKANSALAETAEAERSGTGASAGTAAEPEAPPQMPAEAENGFAYIDMAAAGDVREEEAPAEAAVCTEADSAEKAAPASVYSALSLPGGDAARNALAAGDWCGVCVFYDALPEGLPADSWEPGEPAAGEKERWLLSAEDLRELRENAACDEIYFGDLSAGQGLVITVAGQEER